MTHEKDIQDQYNEWRKELETLSPVLAAIQKTNPFKVPEGYFRNSNEAIIDSIKGNSVVELPGLKEGYTLPEGYFDKLGAKVIDKIKNNENKEGDTSIPAQVVNPFKVPTTYFDELPGKVMSRLNSKRQVEKPKVINMYRSGLRIAMSIAAIFVIGLFTFLFFINKSQNKNQEIALNNISNREINNYLIENIGEIDEETMLSDIDDFDAISQPFIEEALENIDFSEEEMDDFIINQIEEDYL
jgi:hypothetical protein